MATVNSVIIDNSDLSVVKIENVIIDFSEIPNDSNLYLTIKNT